MSVNHRARYPYPIEKVYQILLSNEYAAAKYAALGNRNYVRVSNGNSNGLVIIKHRREVRSEIPSFARRILNEWNRLDETYSWQNGAQQKIGSFVSKMAGQPVSYLGNLCLRADGDETVEEIRLEISVRIPLIGQKLLANCERQAAEDLKAEIAFNQHYFSRYDC